MKHTFYDHDTILIDCNLTILTKNLDTFMNTLNLETLMKTLPVLLSKPTSINLILTTTKKFNKL